MLPENISAPSSHSESVCADFLLTHYSPNELTWSPSDRALLRLSGSAPGVRGRRATSRQLVSRDSDASLSPAESAAQTLQQPSSCFCLAGECTSACMNGELEGSALHSVFD